MSDNVLADTLALIKDNMHSFDKGYDYSCYALSRTITKYDMHDVLVGLTNGKRCEIRFYPWRNELSIIIYKGGLLGFGRSVEITRKTASINKCLDVFQEINTKFKLIYDERVKKERLTEEEAKLSELKGILS